MPVFANTFQNIISNCNSFHDFFTWLCDLESGLKGSHFEKFCCYYMRIMYDEPVKNYYSQKHIPAKVLTSLGLPKTDFGIDGLLELQSGEWVTVQVKFKSNILQPTPWADLSTWLASTYRLAPKGISRSILFTNANVIHKELRNVPSVRVIKDIHLNRLEPWFFQMILVTEEQMAKPRRFPLKNSVSLESFAYARTSSRERLPRL